MSAHSSGGAEETAGRVLHAARWYDLLTRACSLGRLGAIRKKLVELAAPAPGEAVLDVGCGTGTLAIELKSKVGSGSVQGIDASPEMIAVAHAKSAKASVDVDFRVALIESLPFPDGSFDLVTSSLMLHHLPEDLQRRGLAEVRRVLKPEGRFMAMDLRAPGHSPLDHLRLVLGHGRGRGTVDTLVPLLRESGFGVVEVAVTRHRNFVFIRAQ